MRDIRTLFMHFITSRLRRATAGWARFTRHFRLGIRYISGALGVCTYVAALACVVALMLLVGFEHTTSTRNSIHIVLRVIQGIFLTRIIFDLTFRFSDTVHNTRVFKWIVDAGVMLSLLPLLYPHPEHPWIPWLEQALYSPYMLYGVLGTYSLTELCYGVMRLAGRRTNPALMLGTAFLVFILTGSLLLMMPRAVNGTISFTDSFFVATSAVSITGLSTVDIATTFTPLGQTILCVLLQIGGIGIITFTSFFAMFFSGNQSIFSQLLVRDIIYTKSMSSLIPTLLYIIVFTLSIELAGAAALYFTIPDSALTLGQSKIMTAIFLSMASFCNAGFTNIEGGLANETLLHGDQSIYIVTSVLIMAGAIGYPILVNLRDIIRHKTRSLFGVRHRSNGPRPIHLYDLNTKLVLTTTFSILLISSALFFIIESSHSMAGLPLYDRIVQSVFNSVTPRSAGFISINPVSFTSFTLIIVMVQMWIGGSSQSMAGGIKVNTVAALLLNLRSIIRGHHNISAYDRNIATSSIRRANAMVTLSILLTISVILALVALEPDKSAKDLIFESISAIFTVGSSMGITDQLSVASKYILCAAMFFGRVGLLSLLTGFCAQDHDPTSHYPSENIIIN